MDAPESTVRPYLIRAWHEWCTDQGFTPHLVVQVDARVQVPMQFVQDGQIVLNVSYGATSKLKIDNDYIAFTARFSGQAREIIVPVSHVLAIYARENGQGMGFPPPESADGDQQANDQMVSTVDGGDAAGRRETSSHANQGADENADAPPPPKPSGLKRVK